MSAEQQLADLAAAAAEYRDAMDAMHTAHNSTDVHGRGGIAGAAMTQHCAVICTATEGRMVMGPGRGMHIEGDMNKRAHDAERRRLSEARFKLNAAITAAVDE